jgi:hypothetical protein
MNPAIAAALTTALGWSKCLMQCLGEHMKIQIADQDYNSKSMVSKE